MSLKHKTVGKRAPFSGPIEKLKDFFELVLILRQGLPFIPKGIHKFKSHEEAQEWTKKMLTRRKA